MLSRNISSIINKYNENGTIIEYKNKFYWFNGQRYEYWCLQPKLCCSEPIYHDNSLYVLIDYKTYKYRKKKFIRLRNWNDNVFKLLFYQTSCLFQKSVHLVSWGFYMNNNMHGQRKPTCCGSFIFGFDNHIYVVDNKINEKLNLSTQIWSTFKKTPFYLTNGCFVNNRFYNLTENSLVQYYDPKLDEWI